MEQKGVIESLTSLRFFAAFAIVLHHARGLVFPNEFLPGVPLSAGVSFFFVLSGFILAYVYTGKMESVGLYKFYTSRFSRIWPAHIFTMMLVIALFPPFEWTLGAQNVWIVTLLNGFLLQSLVPVPAYYFSFNGVSWSISSEFFFYAAFPFLLLGLSRNWIFKLVSLLFLGGAIAYLFDIHNANYYSPDKLTAFSGHGLSYISPLSRIQEFFIGMLFFKLFDHIKVWRVFGLISCTVLEIFCILAVMLWTQKAVGIPYALAGAGNSATAEFWSHCSMGVLFGFIILFFAINKGLVSKLLQLRVFIILGEISFSMYMIHQIIFRYYSSHRPTFSFLSEDATFPFLLTIVIASSYMIWRLIELPAQVQLKNFFAYLGGRQRRQAPTTTN
ncbi:Peptidoglycan/LPS O-acetylase OafA/YrhL, contains acyltransferase and SGNH-hydrolase domains [Pseudomonas sp. NFIX10]|uniref:acyltransferase family protein n=1 Tax=unclassified Pseudomonas TaxID=196821 RepID=UPI0008E8B7D4|nr:MULTISPECIES: acyltransferase [unclassified Pseudomonas]SFA70198.1 Peptidoglycan/LPS O-acetylase OafA/YrhL, contains acyltransferase and SGNH-hydrolase domains [Pseudomonas sp. NFIX10]SFE07699.1 Peptidoglycan/LPS O-acetylase OafA/YrhL, contains acyltransferase and SGNH-hydrolase domains [Pseudomonas sp. NFACC06-1]